MPVSCVRSRAPLIALELSYRRRCLVALNHLHLGSIQQRNSNIWPSVPSVGADKFGLPVFLIHNPLYLKDILRSCLLDRDFGVAVEKGDMDLTLEVAH